MNKINQEKKEISNTEKQKSNFITENLAKIKKIIGAHQKASIVIRIVALLLLIIGIIVVPRVHQNIREKEVNSMIMASFGNTKKIILVPDGKLQDTIKKEKDLSVALVDPNDRYYEDFEKVLSSKSKMKNYDGKLYFYPMVYNKKKLEKEYKLQSGLTLIYFENKKEVNRVTLDSQKEVELYLIDHLNSLPMSHSIDVPIEPEPTVDSSETDGENQIEQEEEIDELGAQESVDQIQGELTP